LSAVEGIFHLIDRERTRWRRTSIPVPQPLIFKTPNIYFEVDFSIEQYCQAHGVEPRVFAHSGTAALVKAIKADLPQAVFLTPISNMYGMEVTDIRAILTGLCDPEWADQMSRKRRSEPIINLVIDNTCAGNLAAWKDFDFRRLPSFIAVISFESLIKFSQDGMDLAPAGLVTVIGEHGHPELDSVRKRHGLWPTENTIRKLAHFTDREQLERKLKRHSRNTMMLARGLQELAGSDNFISEVILPALPAHPSHRIAKRELRDAGGLLNLGLNFGFLQEYREYHLTGGGGYLENPIGLSERPRKAQLIANAFLKVVIELAKFSRVELNLGTSFGFNVTRAAVYDHHSDEEGRNASMPYLRLAPGTESLKDLQLILACFRRASEIFGEAIQQRRILSLSERIEAKQLELLLY
jgi:hypothetical protein